MNPIQHPKTQIKRLKPALLPCLTALALSLLPSLAWATPISLTVGQPFVFNVPDVATNAPEAVLFTFTGKSWNPSQLGTVFVSDSAARCNPVVGGCSDIIRIVNGPGGVASIYFLSAGATPLIETSNTAAGGTTFASTDANGGTALFNMPAILGGIEFDIFADETKAGGVTAAANLADGTEIFLSMISPDTSGASLEPGISEQLILGIPEPATLILFAGSLAGFLFLYRRRPVFGFFFRE